MSSIPAAPRTGFKFMISVRQGPDKGASYQLLPPKVTIGRGTENNVVLNDPRVSRAAALIEFTMEQITITDLSSREAIAVNGRKSKTASIKNGDAIAIGETEFLFIVEAIQMPGPSALATVPRQGAGMPANMPFPPPQQGGFQTPGFGGGQQRPFETPRARPQRGSNEGGGKMVFYGALVVVVGGLVWFLSQDQANRRIEQELRTESAMERDIKTSEERTETIIKKRSFASVEDKTRYEEAQKHYLMGFRDYQDGQWGRAMRSFETAYTIDPMHELSQRYFRLAEKQRDETVALLTKEGLSYKDKNMYRRCQASFSKVMDALTNREDMKYKQAKALHDECEALEAQRFE
ncbi:MAG: FHA domain-containing protein [Bdellovibrionota bacterium]